MESAAGAFALVELKRLEDILPGHAVVDFSAVTWLVVYQDQLEIVTPGGLCVLRTGDLAIFLPGCQWHMKKTGEQLSGYFLQFSGAEAVQVAGQCGFSMEHPVRSDVVWSLKPALDIWLHRLEKRVDNPFGPAACAHVLGVHLYNSCSLNNTGISLAQRLKSAIDYAVYSLPTVTELIENFGVSRTTLFRVFKQEYGTSLKPYLQQEQLKRAQLLLWDPRQNIVEIAAQCGYKTASHFIAAFRKQYGVSPGVWRDAQLPK